MKERRNKIMKRLVMEELERREMLDAAAVDYLTTTSLTLTSLETTSTDDETTSSDSAPDATSGVGQQTITTGANTPGIGSFATPTAGPSKAGGTGNINQGMTPNLAATDAAIEQLSGESAEHALAPADAKVAESDPPAEAPARIGSKPALPRLWSLDADESDAEEAAAVGGAKR